MYHEFKSYPELTGFLEDNMTQEESDVFLKDSDNIKPGERRIYPLNTPNYVRKYYLSLRNISNLQGVGVVIRLYVEFSPYELVHHEFYTEKLFTGERLDDLNVPCIHTELSLALWNVLEFTPSKVEYAFNFFPDDDGETLLRYLYKTADMEDANVWHTIENGVETVNKGTKSASGKRISFYNKNLQQRRTDKQTAPVPFVRWEVRYGKDYLKKYSDPFSEDTVKSILNLEFSRTHTVFDIYDARTTNSIVKRLYSSTTAKNRIRFVSNVNRKYKTYRALLHASKGSIRQTVQRNIRDLFKHGVHFITVPRSWHQKKYPSPFPDELLTEQQRILKQKIANMAHISSYNAL